MPPPLPEAIQCESYACSITPGALSLHDSERDLRGVLRRMMHRVMRDYALRLIVIVAAGVQVAIEAREIAARYFNADTMPGGEPVARGQRLQGHLVHLVLLHPHRSPIIALPIAQT